MPRARADRSPAIRGVVAVLLVVGLAAPAVAQNALGAGDVLDGNLNVNGRRNQAAPRVENTIRAAQSVVTGNAAQGRGFRGDVGYTAAGDFRAELGSDAIFSFRRDSYFSGLSGRGIRGTEALQYQSALTVGASPSAGLMRGLVLQRDFSSPTGFDRTFGAPGANRAGNLGDGGVTAQNAGRLQAPGRLDSLSPADFEAYQRSIENDGAALWSTRATASYVAMRSLQPAFMAGLQNPNSGDQIGITASPLRGLRAEIIVDAVTLEVDDVEEARGRTTEDLFRLESTRQDTRVGAPNDAQGRRAETASEVAPAYVNLFERYRTAGQPRVPDVDDDAGGQTRSDAAPWHDTILELRERAARAMRGQTAAPLDETSTRDITSPQRRARVEQDTVDLIRRGSRTTFSGFGTEQMEPDSLYTMHLRAGEQLLAAGRYFDAEARFTVALSLRSLDPIAEIARVHAQIGAGMYRSAASNLRRFLALRPEMSGIRYGDRLRTTDERRARTNDALGAVLDIVDPTPAASGDTDTAIDASEPRRAEALLIAYLAFQADDAPTIARALEALRLMSEQAIEDGDAAAEGDLLLANLLRGVWLEDDDG